MVLFCAARFAYIESRNRAQEITARTQWVTPWRLADCKDFRQCDLGELRVAPPHWFQRPSTGDGGASVGYCGSPNTSMR